MGVENESGLVALSSWLQSHPTLPRNIDPLLLQRYYHAVRFDVGAAKKLLELSFTVRNSNPKIFLDRDPSSKASLQMLQVTDMLPLPRPTKENFKVLLYRLADTHADKFNFNEAIKLFFIVADVRLKCNDIGTNGSSGITDGEIPIFDMAGLSLKHLMRVVLSTLRVYMKYTQECHPVRLKHIHVLNCSPFLDRVMLLVKPFMNSEVFKLMHFHLPNSNTLDAFVPRELLPNEYGGRAGSLVDLKRDFVAQIMEHRDYVMDQSRWCISTPNNNNGSKPSSSDASPQIEENFQTLCID